MADRTWVSPSQKKKKGSNQEQLSIPLWIALSLTLLFLFIAPFKTGLFNGYTAQYEGPIYVSVMAGAFILLLLSIYFFSKWRLESYRDLLSLYVCLIPITFWLSTIAAASVHLSKNMAYIHMLYASLFLSALYAARSKIGAAIIQYSIVVSGYIIVLYGIANMFANAYFQDAVMFTDQGYRVTAVFQYANAYAAFLMCILLCCLYYIVTSKKWFVVGLHALMLVPIMLSFWLTLSRGGIVTFPFIFLCVLPLLTFSRQMAFTLYSIISVVIVFPILKPMENKSTELVHKYITPFVGQSGKVPTLGWFSSESLAGWGTVMGMALLGTVLVTLLQVFVMPRMEAKLSRFSSKTFSRLAFPLALVAVSTLAAVLLFGTGLKSALPDSVQKRVESINFKQHSVIERGVFYKDSIKVFKEYPILGAGGGGWAAVYEKYQNNPYVSRQAHNFFLQYLVEVGIVGFAVFLLLLLLVLIPFVKRAFRRGEDGAQSHLVFYLVAVSMLIHSILDFEMSYVFLGALVFLCLGGMASALDSPVGWLQKWKPGSAVRYTYSGIMLAVAAVFVFLSITYVTADRSYKNSIKEANSGKDFSKIMKSLDTALDRIPNHPDYLQLKAQFLTQVFNQTKKDDYWNQAMAVTTQLIDHEPHSRQGLEQQYTLLMTKQQYPQALNTVETGLTNYPWELSFYERKASLLNVMWNQAYAQQNKNNMDSVFKQLQENYKTVEDRNKELANLPKEQLQGRPFYLSPLIRYSVGQVKYQMGQAEEAFADLQAAGTEAAEKLKGNLEPVEREQMKIVERWYQAAAEKLGKSDPASLNAFLTTFPDERQQIDTILNAVPVMKQQ